MNEKYRQRPKTINCTKCNRSFVGHHLSKLCDACYLRPCGGCGEMFTRAQVREGMRYCSSACKELNPRANRVPLEKLVKKTCECGVQFHPYSGASRVYCSPECSKKYDRKGDWLRANPELAKQIGSRPKPNHGLRGYKQSLEHLTKRMGDGSIRPSQAELNLVAPLADLGFEHTGYGTWWRTWRDGTHHNPDFLNRDTHTVLEYFGLYWHRADIGREDEIKQSWAEIGYDCIILWEGQPLPAPIVFMQR